MIRVLGSNGAQYVPFVRSQNPDRHYDLIIEESPTSPNQREETFGVLVNLIPFLAKLGIQPPPNLLDYMPIPKMLAEEWKQSMAQRKPDPLNMAKTKQADASAKLSEAKAQREMKNIGNDEMQAIAKLTT